VSCERGVIRQSPDGLFVHTEAGCEEIPVERSLGQAAELIELRDAVAEGRPVFPDGRWGMATLEICLAMLESARTGRTVETARQVAVP
jgi:phthalate 4,5-cis-dihydrodiol dehydrogenase